MVGTGATTTGVPGPPNVASHKRRTTHFFQSHLTRKRALSNHAPKKTGHLYHSDLNSNDVPHPLRLFPAPRDRITDMWVSKETKASLREYERVYPWATESEEKEEGHLGILTLPTDDTDSHGEKHRRDGGEATSVDLAMRERHAKVRRAWRMLTRRNLLAVEPLRSTESLRELHGKAAVPGYVMVRADCLHEHMHLESKLRTDRHILKEQCTWYFTDAKVSAREALPLMKMAVDEVCDREMAVAARAYAKLRSWKPHRANALVTKAAMPAPPLPAVPCTGGGGGSTTTTAAAVSGGSSITTCSSTVMVAASVQESSSGDRFSSIQSRLMKRLKRLPVGSRFGYVSDLFHQIEKDLSGHERELMSHEECLQRQVWRYQDARERKEDYETYYTLAHVFGILSQEMFDRSSRPGRFYYTAMSNSARGFQRMWRRRWPPRKRRKLAGTIYVQTLWRAYHTRKRWRPIVRLRLKYGYRAQMKYRFIRWFKVIRAIVGARVGFENYMIRLQLVVLREWASFVCGELGARKEAGKKLGLRIHSRFIKRVFGAWSKFTKNNARIRRNFIRVVKCPYLKWWHDAVMEIKRDRQERKLAVMLQALARGFAARKRYRRIQDRIMLFRACILRRVEMKRLRSRLQSRDRALVMAYVTDKRDALIATLITKEKQRLDGLSAEVKKAEAAGRRNPWLTEADITQALVTVRHDYEVRFPPPFRAADPCKHAETYVLPEHYERLVPEHARFHQLLVDKDKVMVLYQYLARLVGIGTPLWTLNFWRAVENVRSMDADRAVLYRPLRSRLLQIVDRYLSKNCANPTHASPGVTKAAEEAAGRLGQLAVLKFGIPKARAYGAVLQQLFIAQYEGFLYLLREASDMFFASEDGKTYVKGVEEERYGQWKKDELVVMAKHRQDVLLYARGVKKDLMHRAKMHRQAVNNQAGNAVAEVEAIIVDEVLASVCAEFARVFNDVVAEVFIDSVDDTTEEIVEALFKQAVAVVAEEVYVEGLSTTIIDDYVMEFVSEEMVDEGVEEEWDARMAAVDALADKAVRKAQGGVVGEVLAEVVLECRREQAVVTIQCFFRRRLAIKAARRQVSRVLIKKWDPDAQYYYYINTQTNETSWEKPRIILRLFPLQAILANGYYGGHGGYGSSMSFKGSTGLLRRSSTNVGPVPTTRPPTGGSSNSSTSSASRLTTPRPSTSGSTHTPPPPISARRPSTATTTTINNSASATFSLTSSPSLRPPTAGSGGGGNNGTSRPPTAGGSGGPPHRPPTASSSSSSGSSSRPHTTGSNGSGGGQRPSTATVTFEGDRRPSTATVKFDDRPSTAGGGKGGVMAMPGTTTGGGDGDGESNMGAMAMVMGETKNNNRPPPPSSSSSDKAPQRRENVNAAAAGGMAGKGGMVMMKNDGLAATASKGNGEKNKNHGSLLAAGGNN